MSTAYDNNSDDDDDSIDNEYEFTVEEVCEFLNGQTNLTTFHPSTSEHDITAGGLAVDADELIVPDGWTITEESHGYASIICVDRVPSIEEVSESLRDQEPVAAFTVHPDRDYLKSGTAGFDPEDLDIPVGWELERDGFAVEVHRVDADEDVFDGETLRENLEDDPNSGMVQKSIFDTSDVWVCRDGWMDQEGATEEEIEALDGYEVVSSDSGGFFLEELEDSGEDDSDDSLLESSNSRNTASSDDSSEELAVTLAEMFIGEIPERADEVRDHLEGEFEHHVIPSSAEDFDLFVSSTPEELEQVDIPDGWEAEYLDEWNVSQGVHIRPEPRDTVSVDIPVELAEEFINAGFLPHRPPITDVQTHVERELDGGSS